MGLKERRLKEKENRIKEIQKAAKEVFFKNGFRDATLGEISEKAEISKATIYLYFKNKEDLYISLMSSVSKELGRLLEKFEIEVNSGKYKNHHQIIRAYHDLLVNIYRFDADGLKIVRSFQLGDFRAISKATSENVLRVAANNFAITRRSFALAQKLGLIRKLDIIQVADILWALFIGIVQLEERKMVATKKDHLESTLQFGFSLIADAFAPSFPQLPKGPTGMTKSFKD